MHVKREIKHGLVLNLQITADAMAVPEEVAKAYLVGLYENANLLQGSQ